MRKIGVALGGGGARGLAHIGVLKYLIEHKYEIAWITGTSMGAIIGGLFAAGVDIGEIEKLAIEMDRETVTKLFFPTFPRTGFIDGNRIVHFLESIMGRPHFEDLDIPFGCVSTDIKLTDEVNHTKGDVVEALRASMSIPVVFTPIYHQEKILVDGGLTNPVPVQLCRELGATEVIAVNVLHASEKYIRNLSLIGTQKREKKISQIEQMHENMKNKLSLFNIKSFHIDISSLLPSPQIGIIDISVRSLFIMESRIAEYRLAIDEPDYTIMPPVGHYMPFDFFKAQEIIEYGYNSAKILEGG